MDFYCSQYHLLVTIAHEHLVLFLEKSNKKNNTLINEQVLVSIQN